MKILAWSWFLVVSMVSVAQAQVAGLPSLADLVENLLLSVVNISTVTKDETADKHTALGSGFIIDDDGYILTNGHVVENAKDITVILHNNQPLSAIVVGVDKKTDLALIKVDTTKVLVPAVLGDSDDIRVGDWIVAIGNPFGLGGSVTAGIVSAKSRDISAGAYDNYIQTDAAINQGSSGGPMFNLKGEVIGINTALFSTTGASMGVGFAIPVNQAYFVVSQLKEFGKVNRSWLGLKIQPQLENEGVVVSGVSEKSPAAKMGIEAGDIIVSYDGKPVTTPQNLSRAIAETAIGKVVEVEILRENLKQKVMITTEALPEETVVVPETNALIEEVNFPLLGIELREQEKSSSGQSMLAGLYVEQVIPNSDAAVKGIQKSNILLKIDGKDVITIDNANDYVQDAVLDNQRPVELTILDNNGNVRSVSVRLMEGL